MIASENSPIIHLTVGGNLPPAIPNSGLVAFEKRKLNANRGLSLQARVPVRYNNNARRTFADW
jgi:hypothetical protein